VLPPPLELELPCARVVAATGTTLHRHHLDPLQPPQWDAPFAEVVAHPSDPQLLGLRNASGSDWEVTLLQGRQITVAPGMSCNLAALRELHTDGGVIRVRR
jgi:hypothetical protein